MYRKSHVRIFYVWLIIWALGGRLSKKIFVLQVLQGFHYNDRTISCMMTSSNGNISTLLALCAGNSLVTYEFPTQGLVTRNFVFFDLHLNKRLSKQSWCRKFETLSRPLWRHCNRPSYLYKEHPCTGKTAFILKRTLCPNMICLLSSRKSQPSRHSITRT